VSETVTVPIAAPTPFSSTLLRVISVPAQATLEISKDADMRIFFNFSLLVGLPVWATSDCVRQHPSRKV